MDKGKSIRAKVMAMPKLATIQPNRKLSDSSLKRAEFWPDSIIVDTNFDTRRFLKILRSQQLSHVIFPLCFKNSENSFNKMVLLISESKCYF